jgi:putative YphP/YqiW family bacilliredoxin
MMRYPEAFIAPMRAELSEAGFVEARQPEDVDRVLSPESGTVLMMVNSVCGCAAGKARPGVIDSLKHSIKPQKTATVFAGADVEATARVRELLSDYPPSSPSIALFRDGKPVFLLQRFEIEGRGPQEIAAVLKKAYEQHCAEPVT